MGGRVVRYYSSAFKRQVVEELESGRFSSIGEARAHYEIGGKMTIRRWLGQYGKSHLVAKVVRVERPDERDRIRALKRQVADLERALGRTQAECLLEESFLSLACEQLGEEVGSFKKKCGGTRFTGRSSSADPPPSR